MLNGDLKATVSLEKKTTNLDKTPIQTKEYKNSVTGKPIPGMTDEKYQELREQGHPLKHVSVSKKK